MKHELQFAKEKTALKFYLIGSKFYTALKALGFAERYTTGLRKDGKTPELHHQVRIALQVTQLKFVLNEEMCIILALLHDVREDYQIPHEVLVENFGQVIADKVWKLTKKFQGVMKNQTEYIAEIALDPDCSIVKGLDRNDNLESMVGVFSTEKKKSYSNEAFRIFLPMLRKASKLFPDQQTAYHTIMIRMKQLISSAQYMVAIENERDAALKEAKGYAERLMSRNEECMTMTGKIMELRAEQGKSWAITNSKTKAEHDERVQSMVDLVNDGTLTNDKLEMFKRIRLTLDKNSKKLNIPMGSLGPIMVMIQHELGISELEFFNHLDKRISGPITS